MIAKLHIFAIALYKADDVSSFLLPGKWPLN